MRKKLLFMFYIVSAMIVCVHLAARVNFLNKLQTGNAPLFVITYSDNNKESSLPIKESINYKEWATKFEEQTK